MRCLILAALLISVPAIAKDFRALNFGDSCTAALLSEEALGSDPIPGQSGLNQQTFKGNVFDREVIIVYLCKDGSFTLGNYLFSEGTLDKALSSLHEIYDRLNNMYGVPWVDCSPWQYGADPRDSRAIASDSTKYMVVWQDQQVFLDAHIASRSGGTRPDWRVIVRFSRRSSDGT
jgi:hypothetical protein